MHEAQVKGEGALDPSDYVQLNRWFRELGDKSEPEQTALDRYTRVFLGRDPGLSWGDLLKWPLVVVLGEPGSGKTYEFRHQCERLRANGEPAFFIRLDALIGEGLESVLGPDRYREFQKWQKTQEHGTFFLDSVDEAKFRKTSDFYRSLERFRDALGSERLNRVRILFSSRIWQWQPHADKSEVLTRFSCPHRPPQTRNVPGARKDEPILVVQIAPLDREQVGCYVRARGISNHEVLIEALDHQHLWEFARRPADVVDLLDYWRAHGQFGSLTEMMDHSIASKLRTPQRDRDDPLSEHESRHGAQILGAATVLCRRFDFRVPDEVFSCPDAIDTDQCLPGDWPLKKRQALLTRPLFDGASYGRIRFHTRRVAEYLAAEWITRRMNDGCPVDELDTLLFGHIEGRRAMRQAMAPVIAWLAAGGDRWNGDLRDWVLESNPSVHLQYGDPSKLPLDYKRRILGALIRMSEGRNWLRIDSLPELLGRLATADLADDLCQIIRNHDVAVDVRKELIQMVRFGRLQGCLGTLLDLTQSTDELEVLKHYAAAAIRDMGDEPSRWRLADIVRGWAQMSPGLCATVCEALYPGVVDAQELVALVQKAGAIPPKDSYLTFSLRSHLESAMRQKDAEEILAGFLRLHRELGFSWTLDVVPTILLGLLQKTRLTTSEVETATEAFCVIAHHVQHAALHDDKLGFLDQATTQHPAVRQHYLWCAVEEWRQQNSSEPIGWMSFPAYYEVLHPKGEDLTWLLDDIARRPVSKDRVLALHLVMETWHQSGRKWTDRQRIRRVVAHDTNLLSVFRQLAADGRWLFVKRLWYRHVRTKLGRKSWWTRKLQRVQRRRIWLRGQWTLLRQVQVLKSGQRREWLQLLLSEASGTFHDDKWGVQSWETLRKKRGRWIARATREGCKRFWSTFVPQLPHQKSDPSKIENGVIVGLAGIQAALDDGDLGFGTIALSDAELAVRYALNDFAGFSPWLPDLAKHRPELVRKILCEAVEGEWQAPADRRSGFGVMEDLASHGEGVIPLIQHRIIELLKVGDPGSYSILIAALRILLRGENPLADEVAAIAGDRIPTLSPNCQAFPLWLAIWLQLDAGPAIDLLEETLPKAEGGNQIMIDICAFLAGERLNPGPILSNPSYMVPEQCQRFIPLVFRYVRQSEDLNRTTGGAYAPGNRDFAQMFRDGLLERLSRSEDRHATEALRRLVEAPETAHLRDGILNLLDHRVQKEADCPPWTPGDLRVFMAAHEIDPKTDRDLFRIVCKRLANIRHDVERSDNSLREEIRPDDTEPVLRRWLARKLRERSRGRYTVPQEEEIDQQKRPDLRIENPGTSPVSIEIKWADNWTVPQLLERLENQLFGQYLRSNECRHGIYLLGMIGRKQRWESRDTGALIPFEQVVQIIVGQARDLVKRSDHVQDVAVTTIDFRAPE